MKIAYVKPHMEAVSYTANSSLCGSCPVTIKDETVQEELKDVLFWFDIDVETLLMESSGCKTDVYSVAGIIEFYCKFYGSISEFFVS